MSQETNQVQNAFHQLRVRALRGAPIRIEHVNAAQAKVEQLFSFYAEKPPEKPEIREKIAKKGIIGGKRLPNSETIISPIEPQVTPRGPQFPPQGGAF